MASTSSISGLASGLDTAGIIDQLMQLEAVPQTKLKDQQTSENNVIKALRALNTDTALLASNAAKLAKPETWQTLRGTTTNGAVTATVTSAASPTSFTLTVDQLAASHQLGFTTAANLTDVVAGSSVRITGSDGVAHDVSTGGGTLKEVVAAINSSSTDTGVKATAVKVGDNSYRLLVEATTTGAASAFTMTNGDGNTLLGGAAVRTGTDAKISMGLGISATSSTNTFADLTPGVSVTLGSGATLGSTATVTVAQDSSSISSSVSALVTQLNTLLTNIDTQTAVKTSTSPAGVLVGDPSARSLRSALFETVFGQDNTSLATYGIQTDRYGKLVFDADKFQKAYAADPAGTAARFTTDSTTTDPAARTDGWAARVATVTKAATDTYSGTLTSAINGHTTTVDRLTKSIADWDDRLELRRSALQTQYTALETALSNLQSQSSWLAGQISSLPTYNS